MRGLEEDTYEALSHIMKYRCANTECNWYRGHMADRCIEVLFVTRCDKVMLELKDDEAPTDIVDKKETEKNCGNRKIYF